MADVKKIMNNVNKILVVILFLLLGLGIYAGYRAIVAEKQNKVLNKALSALNSELELSRDDLGRMTASRKVIELERNDLIGLLDSTNQALFEKDKELLRLRNLVEERENAVIALVAELKLKDTTTVPVDSVDFLDADTIENVVYLYPTYHASWEGVWQTGKISINRDSLHKDITSLTAFDMWFEDKKVGKWPFRSGVLTASVRSLNPDVEVIGLRSWSRVEKPKKFVVAVGGGVGFGFDDFRPSYGAYVVLGLKLFEF